MCVGAAKRSICGFMGIPPQVAAIETSGRYFAKSSRFLNLPQLPWEPKQAPYEDESINCKEKIKAAVLCSSSPTRSVVFAKSSGIACLWVQQFQQAFKI
jgi:hypothetical protein